MSELSRPRARWAILAGALLKQKQPDPQHDTQSKRQFQSYELIPTTLIENNEEFSWHEMKFESSQVLVKIIKPKLTIKQLSGFNNTGNVCVWPSEECLALYCSQSTEKFAGKTVLEIGGGQTCLSGLSVSCAGAADLVVLTDGNQESVNNLKDIVTRNRQLKIEARLYRWDDEDQTAELRGEEGFHFILCSDCLFFDSGRAPLAAAIYRLLRPGGTALVMAPERGGTLREFERLAAQHFTQSGEIVVLEEYHPAVYRKHVQLLTGNGGSNSSSYSPDIHFPKLMILQKSER